MAFMRMASKVPEGSMDKPPIATKGVQSKEAQPVAASRQAEWPGPAPNAAGTERTRARIIAALLKKIDQMVEEAANDPSSETGKLVKCLLLTQMTTEDTGIKDLEALLEEERRRDQIEKELEIKKAELKQKERKLKIEIRKVNDVRQITAKAQRAVDNHKPFDYDRALKQISAVIGVGRPLVEYEAPVTPA